MFLLEGMEAMPGDHFFAQIHLEHPVPVIRGDRFVLRSYSPVMTIGGGVIVDPLPKRYRRRMRLEAAAMLQNLFVADEEEIVRMQISKSGEKGISFKELQVKTGIYGKQLENIVSTLEERREVFNFDKDLKCYVCKESCEELEKAILERLAAYHRDNPLKHGMSKDLLYYQVAKNYPQKVFVLVLDQLVSRKAIVIRQELVALATHSVKLGDKERKASDAIDRIYLEAGYQPPAFKDVVPQLGVAENVAETVFAWMVDEGILVRVKEDLVFHSKVLEKLKNRVVEFLKSHGEISPTQFKELIGASRKYAIPLLEYCDREKITLRVGDVRRLRE
jgi:selenocysteine-specific elongation factor